MKVATVSIAGERRVGQVIDDGLSIAPFDLPLSEAQGGVVALIRRDGRGLPPALSPIPMTQVVIEAPIPAPRRNIFCVGKNYHEHAHEFAKSGFDSSAAKGAVPSNPIMFSKVPESVVPCGSAVIIDPEVSQAVDYEAELAVIIGKSGRGIRAKEAFDHVWGYTIINDVTARDLQARYSQWLIGKSQDTFCPMGPFAVTRDEIDIGDTPIRSLRQRRAAPELQYAPADLRYSDDHRNALRRHHAATRDVNATGTPAGVGIGFNPPRYLRNGDVVRIEIGGIGVLENRFEERSA
jgi:2-keto-4-pentenoate hydratase/2-oxohepta-3-ene-1,7-dioic acid hydratase in catechol pathway